MNNASQEGVIIIHDEKGEPEIMISKNGSTRWFSLKEMNFGDFVEYLQADKVQPDYTREEWAKMEENAKDLPLALLTHVNNLLEEQNKKNAGALKKLTVKHE